VGMRDVGRSEVGWSEVGWWAAAAAMNNNAIHQSLYYFCLGFHQDQSITIYVFFVTTNPFIISLSCIEIILSGNI
jgi:hypothetical protein